ncbi:BQ2448_710 [Microbotryum intermedium]|uniref:BQ2448_710 protein n=1 Tax=Microbotryum intermedium TaxID=269621 RepID=A0A238F767_9BASI|nr:BQ2448_710 [Microbotryum intermedium]
MGRRGRVSSFPTIAALTALTWAALSLAAHVDSHAPTLGRLLRRAPDDPTSSERLSDGEDVFYTSYRRSPGVILTAVVALIAGSYLCLLGKRGWRFTTGLCTALMGQLLTWIIVVNMASIDLKGIAIWGFSMIGFVVGFAIGAIFWRFGIVVAGADGGLALALGLNLMVPHQSNSPTRMAWQEIASSLTGSFIFAFGIDLLVEQASGFSLGLGASHGHRSQRYIFDHRHLPPGVMGYQPRKATRIFLGVMWGLAIIATGFQTWRWRKYPFDRTEKEFMPGSSKTRFVRTDDQLRESRGHTFSMSACNGKHEFWEPQLSRASTFDGRPIPSGPPVIHHDQPPSPPSSIVSTEFARGLHSRPPTEYDHNRRVDQPASVVLLRPIPRYAEPNATPYYEETITHTTLLPIQLVAAPPGKQRATVDRVVCPPGHSGPPSHTNLVKRTSYRKPVPPLIDPQLLESAALGISTGRRRSSQPTESAGESTGDEKESFEVPIAQGFASGREYPLDQRRDNPTLEDSRSETPIFGIDPKTREISSLTETYGTESPRGSPSQADTLPHARPAVASRFTSTTDHLPISPLAEPEVQHAAQPDPRDLARSVLFWPEGMPASSRGRSPGTGSDLRA